MLVPTWGPTGSNPELYQAYIGAGQAVDLTGSDQSRYADTLAWALANGDTDLVKELTAVGPPPYGDIYAYALMLLNEGKPSRTWAGPTPAAARYKLRCQRALTARQGACLQRLPGLLRFAVPPGRRTLTCAPGSPARGSDLLPRGASTTYPAGSW